MKPGPPDPRTTPALAVEDLAELAEARGPAAAAAAIAAALTAAKDTGSDGYAMGLHSLVAADPAAWTADVPAVLNALKLPELGAYYLAGAAEHADRPGAFPGGALAGAVTAALGLVRALARPATAARPPAGSPADRGGRFADQALADLLTAAWRNGTALAADPEQEALARLHTLAAALARPAPGNSTSPAADASAGAAASPDPAATADHRAPAGSLGEPELLGSDPRVRALGCLLEYAVHHARTRGQMPADVLQAVAAALPAAASQKAVARAIGVRLPALHRYAPAFTATHHAALYRPAPGRPSPAAAWLQWGPPSPPLLAALDRADLIAALRDAPALAHDAAAHTAAALLDEPALLGQPAAWWTQLASTDDGDEGGPAAVSRLLEAIALYTPRTDASPLPPARQARAQAAQSLWRAALAAGLPTGALAGAGAFAKAAFDDPVWLELTRASAEHSPDLRYAERVAERAATRPSSQDALLLAAVLVTHAPGTWTDVSVLRHARTLIAAAAVLPATERPPAWEGLRTALVNAGDIAAAGHL